jgi:NADH-quinone oxidoreductase subunit N
VSFGAVSPITPPPVDWLAIAPELALGGAAVLIVLLKALLRRRPAVTPVTYVVAAAGVLTCAAMLVWQWQEVKDDSPILTMSEMVRVDTFAVFLGVTVLAATAMALLVAIGYLRREQLEVAEYVSLMLFSATGMLVMTTANDLIVVFLALEILSIPLYVLAAYHRRRLSSQEAGMKYFVLGAFSSAIFLYGIALVYGGTGSTSLTGIDQFLRANTLFDAGTLQAGLVLLLVGLGFKVAAVPFHMWTPDVYQGAPTPVTAFMSSATKVAAFAAILRIFDGAFLTYRDQWQPVVWALTALTLGVGSIGALLQVDIKRLLAYSSIAHAGYVLMAVETGTPKGREAALFYLFAYTFMVIGSFAVVTALSRRGDEDHSIDSLRGLASRRPVLACLFVLFLLAQAGIPLTSGFVAKLDVFSATAKAGDYVLVVVGTVATVIAAFAYLRVALAISSTSGDGEVAERATTRRVDAGTWIVLAVCAAATIVLGIIPAVFVHWAQDSTLLTQLVTWIR